MQLGIRMKVDAVPHKDYSKKRMEDFISRRFGNRKYKLEECPNIKENKIQFVFEMKELKEDFITEIREITEAFQQIGTLNMYEITACNSEFIQ